MPLVLISTYVERSRRTHASRTSEESYFANEILQLEDGACRSASAHQQFRSGEQSTFSEFDNKASGQKKLLVLSLFFDQFMYDLNELD
jgi:hypothetical protein